MGKSRQRKRQRQRNSASKFTNHNISGLDAHYRQGKKLLPPLARLEQVAPSSWSDDHMPEMLWAALLTAVFERDEYLACFRSIAATCREWFVKLDPGAPDVMESMSHADVESGIKFEVVLDLTKLSEVSEEQFREFVAVPLKHPLGYAALRPLLLIKSIPGYDRWSAAIGVEPTPDDWGTLARAVAGVLDHQSEKSTDIRWFKLVLPMVSGRLRFPSSMRERIEELRLFPNAGDMRIVRPFIRAGEMGIRRNPTSEWVKAFWSESLKSTVCVDPSEGVAESVLDSSVDRGSLFGTRQAVILAFMRNVTALRVDARLDGSFGLVLFALSLIEEIGLHQIQQTISGRLALRSLVEAKITLKYLIAKNEDRYWESYRVYGAGQAKLAFLKVQELDGFMPPFIDENALHDIANEDLWHEFLEIDVGHWANSNLRSLAEACGEKEVYDQYYGWTSAFMHGHWGAVRDTNYLTCHNPLHRLHRIPRSIHRKLNSVDNDAVVITNSMIEMLEGLYPSSGRLPRILVSACSNDVGEHSQEMS